MNSRSASAPAATGDGAACLLRPRPEESDMKRIAKAAIEAMNNAFYSETHGLWQPSAAWWLSGNALQAVLDYMYKTGSREYMDKALRTIDLQRAPLSWWPEGGGEFRADSTDDTGWWALAMIRMYDLTSDPQYLQIAKDDEAYMYQYWSSDCGGGIIWDIKKLEYKNAISNELYMKLTASLHNRIPGDELYLRRSLTTWNWLARSGMINSESLVNDGLTTDGINNGQTTWTYNQGVILGALAELYRATSNPEYVAKARRIADAVIASPSLSPEGVLTEPHEAEGKSSGDQKMFKGIFMRNLMELSAIIPGSPYSSYVLQNAQTAYMGGRSPTNMYDVRWKGPYVDSTIGTQASAVSLFVSLL